MSEVPRDLVFDQDGLIPVVVQDRKSGDVLMVAYANQEALARMAETELAHFWSRSRKTLWQKGETSGNRLRIRELRADCDRDALLLVVDPEGPTCHTGWRTCFGDQTHTQAGMLDEISRVIAQRGTERPDGSYTTKLFDKGLDHVLKKIGEEAVEVVLAGKGESDERLAEETADLLYHVMVALSQRGIDLGRTLEVLTRRRRR